jgi:MFS family permease
VTGAHGGPDERSIDPDVAVLFVTRSLRMFGYGFLSVVLVLYLTALGFSGLEVGVLLALTLLGDAGISLFLTTRADRIGRRRVLVVGAALMLVAGIMFAATPFYAILLAAATVGVISPSGNEVGPFLAVEQASLSQLVESQRLTSVIARYQLAGSLAVAAGALAAGTTAQAAIDRGAAAPDAYRVVIYGYAVIGIGLAILFTRLTRRVEAPARSDESATRPSRLGLHGSEAVVYPLAMLFALDAFAGGFVITSFVALWFSDRFALDPATLGGLVFAANLLAGFSALIAAPLARRFGLIRTMAFTHLPSNILLIVVPFMPTLPLAAGVLLVRFSISQMDVPTRQAYTMAIVEPDERSAAAGVTGIARSLGVAVSPLVAGPLYLSASLAGAPFVIAGSLKVVYDLLLYRRFRDVRPPMET